MTDLNKTDNDFMICIEKTVSDFSMLSSKDKVLAAVSGGSDSVALVRSLLELKDTTALSVGIAHVNHQLRKADADRDELFVKEFAQKFNLPFFVKQVDVNAYAQENRLSIETAGRTVRYAFFEQVAKQHGYTRIATGHHKEDNAEAVLINLLRGSGPKGLCGIPPVRDQIYIRPLIRATKSQIHQFLISRKQDFVEDASNADPRYLRNKIRNQLIPHLQAEYNPEIIQGLDRLSHILRQEETFWQTQTRQALEKGVISREPHHLVLSKTALKDLDPALLSRVLRMAIETVKNNLNRISHTHIDACTTFCFSTSPGKSLDLPGRIRLYKTAETIEIKKEDNALRDIGKDQKQLRRSQQKKQNQKY